MHHGRISANTARSLKTLRARIRAAEIPSSRLDKTLNLATWNIREFGRRARRTHSLHLIAEILGQFDHPEQVAILKNGVVEWTA